MRILLVEDDQEMRDFVTTELKEAGHDVTGSADGRDGLMLAATTDFDVLVIDRILPQLDGVGITLDGHCNADHSSHGAGPGG